MGLASTLSTALTGLTAAETTIDVVGNNLANSNTVGFKASTANFATQFLQTLSLGSAPTDGSGGTNPRQTGLGTLVADITPDFSQGTIEISSNPTDMAIQGDGFFIVQGSGGEKLYTRNGVFKLNEQNELTTITGNRVLGFGVNDQFETQRTTLEPITIPLGSAAVAQATENVYIEGQLSPTGDIATTAERIQTEVLSDGSQAAPTTTVKAGVAPAFESSGIDISYAAGGALTPGQTYEYRFVYTNGASPPPDPPMTDEAPPSATRTATVPAGQGTIVLDDITGPVTAGYDHVRIYRRLAGDPDFQYLAEMATPPAIPPGVYSFTDDGSIAPDAARPLNNATISGNYQYYVTYYDSSGRESRPCLLESSVIVRNGRVSLTDIPTPPAGGQWVGRYVYRSMDSSESAFYQLARIPDTTTTSFTDVVVDQNLDTTRRLDFYGQRIDEATRLVDIVRRETNGYVSVYKLDPLTNTATIQFQGYKGGRQLAMKEFEINQDTTVADLMTFMSDALGVQPHTPDPLSPPVSQTGDPNNPANPGGVVRDGRIILTGNNGVDNAIDIKLRSMNLVYLDGNRTLVSETVSMPFSQLQAAVGESAVTDTLVYDTLGIPLNLRITMTLENRNSTETTYRWYADSPDNISTGQHPADIAVGTGTITFDNVGNFKRATEATVNIRRDGFPSVNPLTFDLDFSSISGLATDRSNIAVSRQDGFAPGVLTSFITGEDGRITGVFSNGVSRDLGQIRLVRFANPNGLEQRGQNLFAAGVNSGLPIEGDPGSQGIGSIIAGAVELSNTDIGGNLIDLILASTMYRGNTRVITTTQQMLDELLALRR